MTRLINLEIYAFVLVFLRIGSAFMVMPGFMSSYVNTRVRLCIALAVTLVATPLVSEQIPIPQGDMGEIIRFCLFEICYGIFLGLIMQIMFQAVNLAGKLRQKNIPVDVMYRQCKFKKKMEYANKIGVPYLIIIGEEEAKTKLYSLKDMASGEQKSLDAAALADVLLS